MQWYVISRSGSSRRFTHFVNTQVILCYPNVFWWIYNLQYLSNYSKFCVEIFSINNRSMIFFWYRKCLYNNWTYIRTYGDSFTILGLWVLGLTSSNINESPLQTNESKTLFLMTSLPYYCIMGLAEIKTYAQKMQDAQVTKSLTYIID